MEGVEMAVTDSLIKARKGETIYKTSRDYVSFLSDPGQNTTKDILHIWLWSTALYLKYDHIEQMTLAGGTSSICGHLAEITRLDPL